MKTIEIKYYHNPKTNWNSTKPFKDSIKLTKKINILSSKDGYTLYFADIKGGPVISDISFDKATEKFMNALELGFSVKNLLTNIDK